MARFENAMRIGNIRMQRSVQCFCPIGKSWCTYEFTVDILPDHVIPDYLEVDSFFDNEVDRHSYTLEEACAVVRDYFAKEYWPSYVGVTLRCNDARHMPVTVYASYGAQHVADVIADADGGGQARGKGEAEE